MAGLREKKVDLDPLNLGALSALGQNHIENNRLDETLEMFERLVAINRDFPRINEKFGRLYLEQDDPGRAWVEFNSMPEPIAAKAIRAASDQNRTWLREDVVLCYRPRVCENSKSEIPSGNLLLIY
jgi:hypothetical protein